ncbi:MAG: hypothetical protein OEV92_04620 [Nitrospinota bacterium]|nr:hypothetical protein [Nitrospinota bacterium]
MPHRITERPPESQERSIITFEVKHDWASYFFIFALTAGAFFALGALGGYLGKLLSAPHPERMKYATWVLVLAISVHFTISFFYHDKIRRSLARMDAGAGVVQEIWVKNPIALAVGFADTHDPAIVMDIGGGKLLYIFGQWIYDPGIYGAELANMNEDPVEDRVNGMPDPFGFPASEFTLVRMRHRGRALSLKVNGPYLAPEARDTPFTRFVELNDTELLDGDLENAVEILSRENHRRSVKIADSHQYRSTV